MDASTQPLSTTQPPSRTQPQRLSGWSPEALFKQHADDLHRYFLRRTRDADLAADLASETFLRIVHHADRFDASRGSCEQWLYGIARNLLRDHWRHQRVAMSAQRRLESEQRPEHHESTRPFDAVEAETMRRSLVGALNGLSQPYRSAVALRVIDGESYDSIGEHLGCTPSTARVRVFRGLRRLDHVSIR